MFIIKLIYWLSLFLILFTLIGYPISLFFLNKLIKKEREQRNLKLRPFVSIIIPAHNEEKVIERKLNNLIELNYPKELFEIIISSDNSTDKTNQIVEEYIEKNKENSIELYNVRERKGKTNAQNEAVKLAKGEILVFSDANAILDKDSIIHLTSSFTTDDIIYVTGKLEYINDLDYLASGTENNYWNYDLFMREVESNIQTITAGNGALYAIKKDEYIEFDPIKSHDSAIPLYAGINNKRAIYNKKAIAYEKAGETSKDEFKRKIRMSRGILDVFFKNIGKHNIFKHKWFSYFYFGHRTLRYSLFILHIVVMISNIILINTSTIYNFMFILQLIFYGLSIIGTLNISKNKMFYYPYYYSMTIAAQLVGAINQLTGKSKPFWEKAETTR